MPPPEPLSDQSAPTLDDALQLAERVVRAFLRRSPKLARHGDDLAQVASIAAWQTLDRFDATLGFRFSSYAYPRIIGAIRDAIRAEHGSWFGGGQWALRSRREGQDWRDCSESMPEVHLKPGDTFRLHLYSDDLPVGWEAESEDAVRAACRRVGVANRDAALIEAMYLRAECGTLELAGGAVGLSESGASLAMKAFREAMRGERTGSRRVNKAIEHERISA